MAQLSEDCFAFGRALMTLEDALHLLGRRVACVVGDESAALGLCRRRVLAEDISAIENVPPYDNSAVDGYALRFDDLLPGAETRLRVAGRAAAGHPSEQAIGHGEAVRIFTGAPMPAGCDTVMMQEDCVAEDEYVRLRAGIKRGANRRRAGEDVRAGSIVLRQGTRLRPQELGIAAMIGRTSLRVRRPLRVAVFSTGDELCEPGQARWPGAIYDANRPVLIGLLDALGSQVSDLGILKDDLAAIRDTLASAAGAHDLIVTSGGMSVGEEDHVKAAVQSLGDLHFWQLAIKPGRPIGLGQVRGVPFLGLPGNPVAMMVTFLRIARPMILRLAGSREEPLTFYPVLAGFEHRKKPGRREWVRARIEPGDDGVPVACKFPRDGAGILSSVVESDGLIELPEELTRVEAGATLPFLPFDQVL